MEINNSTPQSIIDDVKNLISYSIVNTELENSKFQSLHKSILKKYFGAKNIKINYKEQTIDLRLPVGAEKYTSLSFECLDLKAFLQSCLKSDEQSLFFYQELLSHYDIITAA